MSDVHGGATTCVLSAISFPEVTNIEQVRLKCDIVLAEVSSKDYLDA